MKAILEFNLPEDNIDHKLAINAFNWYKVAQELDSILRNYIKYGHTFNNTDEALEDIREKLHSTMSDLNISFDDVS